MNPPKSTHQAAVKLQRVLNLTFLARSIQSWWPQHAYKPSSSSGWTGCSCRSSRSGCSWLIGEPFTLTNAPVVGADIQTSNGVIHAINGVILPADVLSRLVGLTPQPISGAAIR
ncbi:fasciclin domain-containing protein [Phormidesmis priestleyi]